MKSLCLALGVMGEYILHIEIALVVLVDGLALFLELKELVLVAFFLLRGAFVLDSQTFVLDGPFGR